MGSAQAGDPEAGKAKSMMCAGCHGPKGEGNPVNPKIAGMPEKDFIAALKAYKSGERKHPSMNAIAKGLSDEDIANLAAYYATLK
ncbi:MAG: cytochrome c [Gammaproteobacteria bacterium]|nr:MAG: cytochrome c [Gammaproteobacteria bacterium]